MSKHYFQNRLLLCIAIPLLGFAISALAEQGVPSGPQWIREEQLGQPRFELQVVHRITESSELGRVDVLFQVVNDFLQFIRADSGRFEASIEVALSVSRSDSGQVLREVKTLTQTAKSFELTNSRRDCLVGSFLVELPPGKYDLELLLTDRESKRHESLKRNFTIPARPASQLSLSDLILTRDQTIEPNTGLPTRPMVGGVEPSQSEALFVYLDVWRLDPTATCRLLAVVADHEGKEVGLDSMSVVGGGSLSSYFLPLRVHGLGFGKYNVTLTAESAGGKVERKADFNINYYGLPSSIGDIEQAIKQLKYIASDKEIEELSARFPSEHEQALIAFWNDKFPCPGESVNGKMLEYYSRIEYANVNFSNNFTGWETDRGKVLAIYGQPTDVERHTFETNSAPYEIWYYNHLGKQFVFRDELGFGDYRLVTPLW